MKTNVKTLSDLDLAIMLEDQFGTENLIKAPSGIWHFNGLTWRLLSDDELKAEMETIQQQMAEAKKNERTNALKEVKRLCKEFGFTAGMLKGALAEGRKKS